MHFQIVPHTLKRPKMTKSNLTGRDLSVHAVYINVFCPIRSMVRSVDRNSVCGSKFGLILGPVYDLKVLVRSEILVRSSVRKYWSGPCPYCPVHVRSVFFVSGPVRIRSGSCPVRVVRVRTYYILVVYKRL